MTMFNTSIKLNSESRSWMAFLKNDLQALYKSVGHNLSDIDLALEIERNFGDLIVKKVCIPNGLLAGACLLIAVEIAKENFAAGSKAA